MEIARNYVSRIRGLLKLTSTDFIISDRLILKELLDINVKLVTQQLNKRQGTTYSDLFTLLPCLEMEQVSLYECCNTTSDCMVTRSKKEIKSVVDTYYGLSIQFISSIDRKVEFKRIDHPQRLVNLMKIYPNKKLDAYYWVQNNRIYTTSPDLETIMASIFFKELVDPEDYACSEESTICPTNPLDLPMKGLPKLMEDVTQLTVTSIANSFLRLRQEKTSDNMEGN